MVCNGRQHSDLWQRVSPRIRNLRFSTSRDSSPPTIFRSAGSGFLPHLSSTNSSDWLAIVRTREAKPIGADSTLCVCRNSASLCTWRKSSWSATDSSIFYKARLRSWGISHSAGSGFLPHLSAMNFGGLDPAVRTRETKPIAAHSTFLVCPNSPSMVKLCREVRGEKGIVARSKNRCLRWSPRR